jgi:hypothetical protein
MSVVYKYCDGHGVEILRNLEIKITPPNQFNDPFEFTPNIICSNLTRTAKRMVKEKDGIREAYQSLKRAGQFKENFRRYRQMHKKNQSALIQLAIKRIPSDLIKLQQSLLDVVSVHFGVLCMSKRRDSLLMWGHYCDKHRGIVIGFDDSHPMFKQTPGLHPVNYVRTRVRIDESAQNMNAEWLQRKEEFIFSKNDEWRYEEELRQLFMLSPLRKRALKNGSAGYFSVIPSEAIVNVTLGIRSSPELGKEIQSLLKNNNFSHVKFEKAILHQSDFALDFKGF